MKLAQLLANDPLVSTVYGERHLNDTKGSFADYSEVNPVFDPQGKIAHVVLPYTLLSDNECTVLQIGTFERSRRLVDGSGEAPVPLAP